MGLNFDSVWYIFRVSSRPEYLILQDSFSNSQAAETLKFLAF